MQKRLIDFGHKVLELSLQFVPKVILSIIVLIIGWWIIKRIVKFTQNSIIKKEFDPTIASFSGSALSVILKLVLIITVAGMIGIKTSSFVAVLGAAGLAVGLALQGTLGNLAGGVLILIFKPFKIGDFIESGVNSGEVKAIQFFSTTLQTSEEKTVVIPNSLLSNGTITNLSRTGNLRGKVLFSVGAASNINQVIEIALGIVEQNEKILKSPKPKCYVDEFDKEALQLSLHFFTRTEMKDSLSSEVRISLVEEFRKKQIALAESPKK
jgi:small conductance mechanosensitive channel